jgi:cobalt-precorrin-5B (C1)-methyltransferase
VDILVIKRPHLSDNFEVVLSEKELEKKIKELHPSFLPLRSGFTTGACATAATKAALRTLITQINQKKSDIVLPSGRRVAFPVETSQYTKQWAMATVRKNAGDDPDVTHEALIGVKVSFNDTGDIRFIEGEGVGTVTLPGLDIPVGGPAINPVPRMMMKEVVKELLYIYELQKGLDISVSVENGEELAKKTLNSKLGIMGGISIIGTSCIVTPFSKAAYVNSLEKEIEVAKANRCQHIVINSGAKSERYLRGRFPSFPDYYFVHFGNFIGESLKKIKKEKIENITLGIMLGKAVKLAQGHLDTHSKNVLMDKDFLCSIIKECGYDDSYCEKINNMTMARELPKLFPFTQGEPFYRVLADKCMAVCETVSANCNFELLLIDKDGNILEFNTSFFS